jgi:hypothetical protein
MQLPKNVTVVCGIDCPARIKSLCCQKRWACSWLCFPYFWSHWVWTFLLGVFLLCLRIVSINPVITSHNPGQEGCVVAPNLMHARCSLVGSVVKSHQARYTTPNKRT